MSDAVIDLAAVSARTRASAVVLADVTLQAGPGVLAIVGAPKDGTALLFDVLDGTVSARSGRATVFGAPPFAGHPRVARVPIDAPLPEPLRVDEVFRLASDLRGTAPKDPAELLGMLGVAALAPRRVSGLTVGERRTVALALALASGAELVLVEEPLLLLAPEAPRLVTSALRAHAADACVVVTCASVEDAIRTGDRLGILLNGAYTSATPAAARGLALRGPASLGVVVAGPKSGVAAVAGALAENDAVTRVETTAYATSGGRIVASGPDLALLARAVTRAIAAAGVDVELIEPTARGAS